MFKITLTLVALAAFQGAFASPIPQAGNAINSLTGTMSGLAGSVTGATPLDLSTGRRQEEDLAGLNDILSGDDLLQRQDDGDDSSDDSGDDSGDVRKRQLEGGIPVVGPLLSGLPVVGPLVGGATAGSVGSGLLERQLNGAGLPVIGSTLNGLPVVGSLVGGAAGGSVASGLLKKRQVAGIPIPSPIGGLEEAAAPIIGPILDTLTGGVGAVPGLAEAGNVLSVLKRQDENLDPLSLLPGLGGLEGSDAGLTSLENVPGSN